MRRLPCSLRTGLWACALAVAVLTGCGGSPGQAPAPAPTPTETAGPPPASPAPPVVGGLTATPQGSQGLRFAWPAVLGASSLHLLEDPDGRSGYRPVAEMAGDATGVELPILLPARLDAHYVLQACQGALCTLSAPLAVGPLLASAIDSLRPPAGASAERYGEGMALSANGNTLAVGAPGGTGAVFVYTRQGGAWGEPLRLSAPQPGFGDEFGHSLALSADGSVLAVGAFLEDSASNRINEGASDNSAPDSGAVHIYTRGRDGWAYAAYLKADNTDALDWFGRSLALSPDGNRLYVGAPFEASASAASPLDNSAPNSGAVYRFERTPTGWSQKGYLKAFEPMTEFFGFSLALAGEAQSQVLAVGAPYDANPGPGTPPGAGRAPRVGAVYTFSATAAGDWQPLTRLNASNPGDENLFGHSLALSADGATLVVGAPAESSDAQGMQPRPEADNRAAPYSGAAYVFVREASGWVQQAYLKAFNAEADDRFGETVGLSADGATLVVGAIQESSPATGFNGDPGNDPNDAAFFTGAAYLFERRGDWRASTYIKASDTGFLDGFGIGLALSSDGTALAIGAPYKHGYAGAVFLY
jgi:hypothetical protein